MPSALHELYATAIPRLRASRELDSPERERARLERWQAGLDRTLPTRATPRLARHFEVHQRHGGFPVWELTPHTPTDRTVLYLHGGGYVAPIDAMHVRYAARLARHLGARVLMPDYPLTPTHSWRASHEALVDLAAEASSLGPTVLAGDSAGGGMALAVALSQLGRGGARPERLVLLSPWVDLTTSTPATAWFARRDPWLFPGKLEAYARWWAGSDDDLARPEVSPALADLDALADLPPTLMFCGTRDLLLPGARLLARRMHEAKAPLSYVEEPDLIHVYPLLPGLPEARRAWRTTVDFLDS
ncbi:alpha/beta hydrolase [Nocardioides acrostichi]|uniref:Alpha/beta hydrolase n=1 Tax=Nocardioides acrostichi TaxID=2784339 RepID=A0A930UZS5_9ACTN|nr:alpha/beta hydrolase [Nocardioides acrostichi]MBF4161399.1 alpha/beta hydrolase [Nocardioides acrostichi]